MKPPPIPLIPSGLSEECPDVIGHRLVIRCTHGWGWTHSPHGTAEVFDDETLAMADIEVIPERYVEFTTPRSGIAGRVVKSPPGYHIERFLAHIMSDGCDYDFVKNIAPVWRVIVGDGEVDCDSHWSPILNGESVFFGYGSVGRDTDRLDRSEAVWRKRSEQAEDTNPPPLRG